MDKSGQKTTILETLIIFSVSFSVCCVSHAPGAQTEKNAPAKRLRAINGAKQSLSVGTSFFCPDVCLVDFFGTWPPHKNDFFLSRLGTSFFRLRHRILPIYLKIKPFFLFWCLNFYFLSETKLHAQFWLSQKYVPNGFVRDILHTH